MPDCWPSERTSNRDDPPNEASADKVTNWKAFCCALPPLLVSTPGSANAVTGNDELLATKVGCIGRGGTTGQIDHASRLNGHGRTRIRAKRVIIAAHRSNTCADRRRSAVFACAGKNYFPGSCIGNAIARPIANRTADGQWTQAQCNCGIGIQRDDAGAKIQICEAMKVKLPPQTMLTAGDTVTGEPLVLSSAPPLIVNGPGPTRWRC